MVGSSFHGSEDEAITEAKRLCKLFNSVVNILRGRTTVVSVTYLGGTGPSWKLTHHS